MKDHDRKDQAAATPLLDALCRQEGRVSFHMPGHRQGRIFPGLAPQAFLNLDTTELEGSGDLAAPDRHVLEAYQLAARFYGAGQTWFISSGTTSSIFIMLAASLRQGDTVILPRAVHLAVVHAVAILGLEPHFVSPPEGLAFPDGQPDPAAYLAAMKACPKARACFVTRPDYFGRAMDLRDLARECRRQDILLLVDEAHGAHFAAAPDLLPPTALSQGAHMTCQSGHKTLPALTPASMLHLSQEALDEGLVDPDRLARMVKVFQTSSPSFLIAASLDSARADAASRGEGAIRRLIQLNQELTDRLPASYRRLLPPGADPSRLVLDFAGTGLSRQAFAGALDQAGIDAELIDLYRLVLIPGFDQAEEDYHRLGQVLAALDPQGGTSGGGLHLSRLQAQIQEQDAFLSAPPRFRISPREALFGRSGEGNRVAKAALAPYPPGLPVIWPGEEIRPQDQAYLEKLQSEGVHVRGLEEALL